MSPRKAITTAPKGPVAVKEADVIASVAERSGVDPATVRNVVKALKADVVDRVVRGERVNLQGLAKFEPKLVAGKKKGELVRNPRTGETTPRPESIPASFKVKASASSSIKKLFPAVKSAAGKRLHDQLAK